MTDAAHPRIYQSRMVQIWSERPSGQKTSVTQEMTTALNQDFQRILMSAKQTGAGTLKVSSLPPGPPSILFWTAQAQARLCELMDYQYWDETQISHEITIKQADSHSEMQPGCDYMTEIHKLEFNSYLLNVFIYIYRESTVFEKIISGMRLKMLRKSFIFHPLTIN